MTPRGLESKYFRLRAALPHQVWAGRLMSPKRASSGLVLPHAQAIDLGPAPSFGSLLHALAAVCCPAVRVYIESGNVAPGVDRKLHEHRPNKTTPIRREGNELSVFARGLPGRRGRARLRRAAVYDLALTPELLSDLQQLDQEHALPDIADHLVAYEGEDVLVEVHDVLDGPVLVNADLGAEVVAQIEQHLAQAQPRSSS